MTARLPILLALAVGLLGAPAKGEELVTALSSDMVSIQSNFTGTEIVIFGQVSRDLHTIARAGG